jgi:hypothetical protein
MDHHRKASHWTLLALTCAFIGAVTFGYGALVLDTVGDTARTLVWVAQQ